MQRVRLGVTPLGCIIGRYSLRTSRDVISVSLNARDSDQPVSHNEGPTDRTTVLYFSVFFVFAFLHCFFGTWIWEYEEKNSSGIYIYIYMFVEARICIINDRSHARVLLYYTHWLINLPILLYRCYEVWFFLYIYTFLDVGTHREIN